ncbi:MAG: hypothetical protein MUC40_05555 [Akkermansiaceae bacterium]|jgi:hypothetical protein|nr:hypothetical protein [Akkermansiaceae bacterium]
MNLRLPPLLLAIVCLPCLAPLSKGAEKAGDEITLRLLAGDKNKEPRKVSLEWADSTSANFELPATALSAPVKVSGRSLVLKAPDNEVPLCNITLPDQGRSFAVILAPQKPEGLLPFVVRLDDSDAFKQGDYCLVNASGKTLVVKLGGTEVVLETGNSAISRPTDPVHNHHYNITMSTRGEAGDKTIASTRWPMNHPNRTYVIFQTNDSGRTTYHAVDDFPDGGSKR